MSETIEAMWIPDEVNEHLGQSCIYPNPAKDILRVEGKGILKVELFNIVGQKVLSINKGFEAIDISPLQNGIYFICLKTNEGEKTIKLVVKK